MCSLKTKLLGFSFSLTGKASYRRIRDQGFDFYLPKKLIDVLIR